MLDPKELRLGNIIWDDRRQKIKYVNHRVISDLASSSQPLSYSPIPLTTEWLMKLEFEKKIILGNASGYWYVKDGLSYNESHKGWWFRGSLSDGPRYVHELQNLYYWLNNKKELEFKNINV